MTPIVVRFVVGNTVLLRRLSGWRVCPVCASVFNIHVKPPHVRGVCDVDGSSLLTREDDKGETILERLRLYEGEVGPS